MIGLLTALVLATTQTSLPQDNPKAIEELKTGKRKTANAAWWGFDPVNSTKAIQNAIDSGAKKVVIPNVGQDWIVDPIFKERYATRFHNCVNAIGFALTHPSHAPAVL